MTANDKWVVTHILPLREFSDKKALLQVVVNDLHGEDISFVANLWANRAYEFREHVSEGHIVTLDFGLNAEQLTPGTYINVVTVIGFKVVDGDGVGDKKPIITDTRDSDKFKI